MLEKLNPHFLFFPAALQDERKRSVHLSTLPYAQSRRLKPQASTQSVSVVPPLLHGYSAVEPSCWCRFEMELLEKKIQ